jgi:hypothetical protein
MGARAVEGTAAEPKSFRCLARKQTGCRLACEKKEQRPSDRRECYIRIGPRRGTRATAYGKGGGSTRHFGLLNRFGCLVYERNALPIISCFRCSFLQLERGVPAIGVLLDGSATR